MFLLSKGDDDGRDLVVFGALRPPIKVLDTTEKDRVNKTLGKLNILTFTWKAGWYPMDSKCFSILTSSTSFLGYKGVKCYLMRRKSLLKIIVVRHFFFDPIRLEAMKQKSGADVVAVVDVILQQ